MLKVLETETTSNDYLVLFVNAAGDDFLLLLTLSGGEALGDTFLAVEKLSGDGVLGDDLRLDVFDEYF